MTKMLRKNRQGGLDVTMTVEGGSTTGVLGLPENPEAAPNFCVINVAN